MFAGGGGEEDDRRVGLYHDLQDVVLAFYLAHLDQSLDDDRRRRRNGRGGVSSSMSSSVPRTETKTTTDAPPPHPSPWLFYGPYLATLPPLSLAAAALSSSSTFPVSAVTPSVTHPPLSCENAASSLRQHLPRKWPNADLRRRLLGTSLYGLVLGERGGMKREYRLVWEAWSRMRRAVGSGDDDDANDVANDDDNNDDDAFPSFERYDRCPRAVSSASGVMASTPWCRCWTSWITSAEDRRRHRHRRRHHLCLLGRSTIVVASKSREGQTHDGAMTMIVYFPRMRREIPPGRRDAGGTTTQTRAQSSGRLLWEVRKRRRRRRSRSGQWGNCLSLLEAMEDGDQLRRSRLKCGRRRHVHVLYQYRPN
jgi:hypothetical protein